MKGIVWHGSAQTQGDIMISNQFIGEPFVSTLIIRDLQDAFGQALKREASKRATSVNKLVQQYIVAGLQRDGAAPSDTAPNDLARFAGRWSAKQRREFELASQTFTEVEADLWK
jgi:hypothetical protein